MERVLAFDNNERFCRLVEKMSFMIILPGLWIWLILFNYGIFFVYGQALGLHLPSLPLGSNRRLIMLIINGFFENGVFVPETPCSAISGRQKAFLSIAGPEQDNVQNRRNAWREFSRAIRNSGETLAGEPQRTRFKAPEEIEAL
jgi:hypothetical protein